MANTAGRSVAISEPLQPSLAAERRLAVSLPVGLPPDAVPRSSYGLGDRRVAVRLDTAAKRVFDIVFAMSVLILLSPAIALILVAIALESRGPLFYRASRIGVGGREFHMLKFRKMTAVARGLPLTVSNDDRFTRIGRVLAASKLDEVPQLWNVVVGDMSIVGPRPEDPSFVAMAEDDYAVVTRVKPGVTGLTQLAFARESELLDRPNRMEYYVSRLFPQKIKLDQLYVARRTFAMDLRILWWTMAAVVLRRNVAVDRRTGRLGIRRRVAPQAQVAVPALVVAEED